MKENSWDIQQKEGYKCYNNQLKRMVERMHVRVDEELLPNPEEEKVD